MCEYEGSKVTFHLETFEGFTIVYLDERRIEFIRLDSDGNEKITPDYNRMIFGIEEMAEFYFKCRFAERSPHTAFTLSINQNKGENVTFFEGINKFLVNMYKTKYISLTRKTNF